MRFSYSSIVHNDVDTVWDFIMSFERRPEWIHFIEKCTVIDKKEGWVGTKYQEKSVFLGIPLNITYEVTSYKEKDSWSSICKMPPFYPKIFVTIKDMGNGEIHGTLEFELKTGILGLLPKRLIKKQVDKLVDPCIERYLELLDRP